MSESKDRFIKFLDEVEREKWDAHVEPQTFYISDINFDRILIFENIQEDIKSLCQDLNMSINFPHLNKILYFLCMLKRFYHPQHKLD